MMFTAHTLARSAPRAVRRIAATSVHRVLLPRPSAMWRVGPQIRAFSSSMLLRLAAAAGGNSGSDLSKKLDAEIRFESDMRDGDSSDPPVSVQDFLKNGPWELKDVPGQGLVTLTRQFGSSEKITVTFSIADVANPNEDMMDEDLPMNDDGEAENEQGQNEDGDEPSDRDQEAAVQCRLNIVIEKGDGKGCINIDATAHDATVMVENLYFYQDAALAHSTTPEAVHKRVNIYGGPPFGTLDEDLQLMVEQYLDERGINAELAVFVPDYMDMKEHKEYLNWLKNIKKFVDA